MRKISANLLASMTVLMLMSLTWVGAQQVPQNRKWVAQNPKYVEFSSEGIHFIPRDAKEGSDSVTTVIHLPSGRPWKVAFDVQMVPTTNGGMSVHLAQGTTELGWMGAGDYYKYISGFLGTGNTNMPFDQPWDNNWHSFAYASDGKTLSLWHNGSQCGEATLRGTPNTLTAQSTGIELRMRNVHIESLSPDVDMARNLITKNLPQQSETKPQLRTQFRSTPKRAVAHSRLGVKHRRIVEAMRPSDYPPMADGSPRPDGMFDGTTRPGYPLTLRNRQSNTSLSREELKRMADDYIDQIAQIHLEEALVVSEYQSAITATQVDMAVGTQQGKQASDKADAGSKHYCEHLRDIVTAFATLRAMPGYAEHYVETGWVFEKGDTEGIPGVVGLKNIVAR